MEQIADAPWIRDAEMYGPPPYGDEEPFPADAINDNIGEADAMIGKAIEYLCEASKKVEYGAEFYKDLIDSLISVLDNWRDEAGETMEKMEKGEWD